MAIDYSHITSSDQLEIDADLDLATHKAINVVNPTNPQDAATKNYVDTAVSALTFLSASNFVFNEVLTVTANAATLAFTPVVGTQQVFKNGLLLIPGVGKDYTISGASVTFLSNIKVNDKVVAHYIK